MARINEIVDQVEENLPNADLGVLHRAYVYSARVHQGQMRLSGEPYLTHPLAVASLLADMRLDPVTVAAGLLHDTIEDPFASEEEIREEFDDEIDPWPESLEKLNLLGAG